MRKVDRRMTKGEEFFRNLSAYRARGDIAGMIEALYHDDVELICFTETIASKEFSQEQEIWPGESESIPVLKGKEAVKSYLTKKPQIQGRVLGMSMDYFAASDDIVMYRGTIKTEFSFVKSEEAWYLKDGKMYRHVMITLPPEITKEWVLKGLS